MEKQWVTIIDEAQDMSEAMIQELRYIRNQEMDGTSSFTLLLIGQPEVRMKMRMKKYQAISQRISLSYHLHGLSEVETVAYIRHHMKQTGSSQPLFTDGAMHKVYSSSQGIPRVTNHICLQTLYDAASRKIEIVEESHIGRTLSVKLSLPLRDCRQTTHDNVGDHYAVKERERLHSSFRKTVVAQVYKKSHNPKTVAFSCITIRNCLAARLR